MASRFLTYEEAAEELGGGATIWIIKDIVKRGEVAVSKLGAKTVRIPRASWEAFLLRITKKGVFDV